MTSWKRNSIYITILLVSLASCDLIQFKESTVESPSELNPVARAHDQYLYPEDLEGIVPEGLSAQDSINRVEGYISNWAKKQLLIREASSKIDFDEAEIERKILDYRYSLIGYEYQSFYVNQKLSREVTEEELANYYQKNIDNFVLRNPIVRGSFVVLPKGPHQIGKLKRLMRSQREKDEEELKSYCLRFASTFQLSDSVWMNFDELFQTTPLAELDDVTRYLKRNKFIETEDEGNLYLLKVEEYKLGGDVSPLEFVRDQVINIIINKRKVAIARELEDDIYERAVENKEFEILREN
ncbi:MAG: peptidylprolyl isomerase [Bacteroidota bacterium]